MLYPSFPVPTMMEVRPRSAIEFKGFMDSGMQVDILTEDQLQAFKDAVAGVTADLKAEYGEDACAAFGIN